MAGIVFVKSAEIKRRVKMVSMEHKCKCCGRLLSMEEFYHHYTNKIYAETHPDNCEWHCWICKNCLRKKINNLKSKSSNKNAAFLL